MPNSQGLLSNPYSDIEKNERYRFGWVDRMNLNKIGVSMRKCMILLKIGIIGVFVNDWLNLRVPVDMDLAMLSMEPRAAAKTTFS